jgi:hypothetical protein
VPGQSHPYRVEVALPSWVLDGIAALRRWLLSYGRAAALPNPGLEPSVQRCSSQRSNDRPMISPMPALQR